MRSKGIHSTLEDDEGRDVPDFHLRYPTPQDFSPVVQNRLLTVLGKAVQVVDRALGYGEGYRWLNEQLPAASENRSSPNPA